MHQPDGADASKTCLDGTDNLFSSDGSTRLLGRPQAQRDHRSAALVPRSGYRWPTRQCAAGIRVRPPAVGERHRELSLSASADDASGRRATRPLRHVDLLGLRHVRGRGPPGGRQTDADRADLSDTWRADVRLAPGRCDDRAFQGHPRPRACPCLTRPASGVVTAAHSPPRHPGRSRVRRQRDPRDRADDGCLRALGHRDTRQRPS